MFSPFATKYKVLVIIFLHIVKTIKHHNKIKLKKPRQKKTAKCNFYVKYMLSSILDFTYVFPQNAQLWLDQVEVQLQTALVLYNMMNPWCNFCEFLGTQ